MFQPELTNLEQIKIKIRRITKSPNPSQLTDQQIVDYVNWYMVYDFPEELRLKTLKTNYVFYTEANQDRYPLPVNKYVTVEPPLYIAGFESWWSQSQTEFYRKYNKAMILQNAVTTGDGTVGPYAFTVTPVPLTKDSVVVSTLNSAGEALTLADDSQGNLIDPTLEPFNISNATQANPVQITANDHRLATGDTIRIQNVSGMVELNNNVYTVTVINASNFTLDAIDGTAFTAYESGGIGVPGSSSYGTVNYLTGAISATFRDPIPSGTSIDFAGRPYVAGRPFASLFYQNEFILRPIPDRGYKVEVEAFFNPASLLDDSENPILNEWWEVIALGASLKIFTDRRELGVRAEYMPIYEEQLLQSQRRTIIQQRNQRTSTIYTDQLDYNAGQFFNNY
ncbi:MAG: ubiquitin-activating E1 FCCH domain-containing protein [Ignavibacteria bacterium]|jgi:hypothetical protein